MRRFALLACATIALAVCDQLAEAREEPRNSPEAEDFLRAILDSDAPVPKEIDWRKVPGRVSGVKDMGYCDSGWAFAATGLLEGQQLVRKYQSQLVPLSEQNLVECSKSNRGCTSGSVEAALRDIVQMGGIESERDYPYSAGMGPAPSDCSFAKSKSVMSIAGSALLPEKDEEKLKKVVATYGPVATTMDDAHLAAYSEGVYRGGKCKDTKEGLTHGVLIVGYGTNPSEGDFWIVKNSYDDLWGERGYFRITRGNNTCGIALAPIIATF